MEDSETVPDDPKRYCYAVKTIFSADRNMPRTIYELMICCSLPRLHARPHGRTRPCPALVPTSGQVQSRVWHKWTTSRGSTFISAKWDGIQQGILTYSRIFVLDLQTRLGAKASSTHTSLIILLLPPPIFFVPLSTRFQCRKDLTSPFHWMGV